MSEEKKEHYLNPLFRQVQEVVAKDQEHDCSEGDCRGCPFNMFEDEGAYPRTSGEGCILEYIELAKV
jgi:hypothetical protein